MTLKRFVLVLVLSYSFLSLAGPLFAPVGDLSLSGLLLVEPWERLFSFFFGEGAGPSPPARGGRESEGGGARREEEALSWWRFVFPPERLRRDLVPLGGRVCSPLTSSSIRAELDMGSDPPVRRDDPVVCGDVLVGFVGSLESDGRVGVVFLGDPSSRLVGAEIGEGIAGGRVSFVVGGGLVRKRAGRRSGREPPGETAGILLRYPSTRFGLIAGARAFTSPRFNKPDVPGGYYLGRVSLLARAEGAGGEAYIAPPLSGRALERLAVLVPRDRPGVAGRPLVPPLEIRRREVSFSLPPGFLRRGAFLRVWAGLERGLERGNILVAQGFAVGRLLGAGLFASRAELFLRPGEETTLLRISEKGPEAVRVRVLERSDSHCLIAVAGGEGRLSPGCLLYLSGPARSGSEVFPVCRLLRRMENGAFLVRCGGIRGRGKRGFCLVPEP